MNFDMNDRQLRVSEQPYFLIHNNHTNTFTNQQSLCEWCHKDATTQQFNTATAPIRMDLPVSSCWRFYFYLGLKGVWNVHILNIGLNLCTPYKISNQSVPGFLCESSDAFVFPREATSAQQQEIPKLMKLQPPLTPGQSTPAWTHCSGEETTLSLPYKETTQDRTKI